MIFKHMSTVINNPSTPEDSGSNLVLGIILAVIILGGMVLFFIYGLPRLQNNQNPDATNINVTVPNTITPPTGQDPPK